MAWQPGKQLIAIHILPNNSSSKRNQTIKFGQLLQDNMRSKSKLSICLNQ